MLTMLTGRTAPINMLSKDESMYAPKYYYLPKNGTGIETLRKHNCQLPPDKEMGGKVTYNISYTYETSKKCQAQRQGLAMGRQKETLAK